MKGVTMMIMMSVDESLTKKHNKQETNYLKHRTNVSTNYIKKNISKQNNTPLRHVRRLRW